MDKRLVFEGLVDGGKVVFHRQHEARRELLQLAPGVHQGRRVGHEASREHDLEELLLGLLVESSCFLARGQETELTLGDVAHYAPEHV
jgi:hypothetical protein